MQTKIEDIFNQRILMNKTIVFFQSRVWSDIRFVRISGRIPDIEINRTDSQVGRIFNLTLLKLSGLKSYNLIFYI